MKKIQLIEISTEELTAQIAEALSNCLNEIQIGSKAKEPNEYLTPKETAELLRVNISTVHRYRKKGTLKCYSIEGNILYKRQEVENAIKPLI